MNFSLQQPASPAQASPSTPAWELPQLQRPTRRKGLGGKVLLFVLVIALGAGGVFLAGVPGTSKSFRRLFASADNSVITYKVTRGKLPVTVKERGNLESSANLDVFCQVEGGTTIIMIKPEGTRVAKNDLVCELDSAALKDNLTNQKITTQQAESAHKNAELTLQVAEIAVTEYKEGTYKQEVQTAKGEIALADSEAKRAEDRLAWTEEMYKKKYVSLAQLLSERSALQKAKFTLEQAQTKLDVLEKYTKQKEIKSLESEVEKARADERAKMSTLELERQKEAKLVKQIENCKLYAPGDGLVVYANDPNRFGGSNQPQIEEGAAVRQSQKIFSLPDISQMQVNTKVHESMVDRVARGQRARIRVDAFPTEELTGSVKSVAPLPDPTSFFSSDIKVYSTLVSIDKGMSQLRPGMTAQVEILVTELDGVLSVPLQAVLQFKGKDHVYVKTPNGYERKQVTVGTSNDQLIEVKSGLSEGDQVVLNPMGLMTEEEKREAFGTTGQGDAKTKDWGKAAEGKGGPGAPGGPGGPGGPGAAGKAKGKAKGKGQRGNNPIFSKMQKLSQEERQLLFRGTEEEKAEVAKKAGITDEEREQMRQFRGGGGGGGFGPGGGGGGGGFGPGGGGGGGGGGGFGGGGGGRGPQGGAGQ